ncbi:MAG TPA: HEAT repeat domain-containing protein, partial [Chryseolinea sp.]|nr:HEAT repeat domain-containing protein [Chryseolinea sp.]
LYGAQGSTCTANVSSDVSKNIRFDGQAIWRYHPGSHIFEVFAEGGGNTFDVEIDDKGRIYSGDNGVTRGRYYKQGAYHLRNLGKHGAFTNPYALGFLPDMKLTGEAVRFTHAFVRYQEQNLPRRYHDRMIAINPMQSFVQLTRFDPSGSTFAVTDEDRILRTKDHWFRPVDITTGPDGAVYICDWYDSRLSHVDPRDTWSKSTGRIYRLRNKSIPAGFSTINIKQLSAEELLKTISNPNRWYRQTALTEISDRKDTSLVKPLRQQLLSGNGQSALEALWALHAIEGIKDDVALAALRHNDWSVRMWAVRLIGDTKEPSASTANELSELATREQHPEVRSQLAATAKRLSGDRTISIVGSLLRSHDDSNDPDIPLQLWWALESKSISDKDAIVELFSDRTLWTNDVVAGTILSRLTQRWIMEGDAESFNACAKLAGLAPSQQLAKPLINGIEEGLRGKDMTNLSPRLVQALKPFQSHYEKETVALLLRQGDQPSVTKALQVAADPRAPIGERLSYIRIFGEINQPVAVPALIRLMEGIQSSPAVRQAALEAMARYDDPAIGAHVVEAYPDVLRSDPDVRMAALSLLSLRTTWAVQLLDAISRKTKSGEKFVAHSIDRRDVPASISRQLMLLGDKDITDIATQLWPDVAAASTEMKSNRINEVVSILKSGKGDATNGKGIFATRCGSCHRLFNEGG